MYYKNNFIWLTDGHNPAYTLPFPDEKASMWMVELMFKLDGPLLHKKQ